MYGCANCETEVDEKAKLCPECGHKFSDGSIYRQVESVQYAQPVTTTKGGGFGVASVVLSLLGLIVNPLLILSLIFGIIGMNENRNSKGLAWAGCIISIVGIIWWIVAVLLLSSLSRSPL